MSIFKKKSKPENAPAEKKIDSSAGILNSLASELEQLKAEHADLKAEVHELAQLLAQQFGQPISDLAKKIEARHKKA